MEWIFIFAGKKKEKIFKHLKQFSDNSFDRARLEFVSYIYIYTYICVYMYMYVCKALHVSEWEIHVYSVHSCCDLSLMKWIDFRCLKSNAHYC